MARLLGARHVVPHLDTASSWERRSYLAFAGSAKYLKNGSYLDFPCR